MLIPQDSNIRGTFRKNILPESLTTSDVQSTIYGLSQDVNVSLAPIAVYWDYSGNNPAPVTQNYIFNNNLTSTPYPVSIPNTGSLYIAGPTSSQVASSSGNLQVYFFSGQNNGNGGWIQILSQTGISNINFGGVSPALSHGGGNN